MDACVNVYAIQPLFSGLSLTYGKSMTFLVIFPNSVFN